MPSIIGNIDAIDRDRIELMANQIRELFGVIPDDLDAFALASQISQAEAKKFFIESTRLAQMAHQWHPVVECDRRLAAVLGRRSSTTTSARSWPITISAAGATSGRRC